MSQSRVNSLLEQIGKELQSENVSSDTADLTVRLSQDIREHVANPDSPDAERQTLLEQVQSLEVEFAQNHPRIEGIIRELIDTLSKMGI